MTSFMRFSRYLRRSVATTVAIFCCGVAFTQPDGPGGPPPDGGPMDAMQQQAPRGPSVEKELKRLTQLLTLTTDQQTQIKVILTDRRQQIEALYKSAAKSEKNSTDENQMPNREAMEAKRSEAKSIRQQAREKIDALLNDDQKTKFATWEKKNEKTLAQQQREEEMPPPPPDGAGPPPGGGPPGE